jgi:hypothetical protein
MSKINRISRRRFFILGGGTLAAAFLGGSFLVSKCPLSDSGVCVGPCSAFIDRTGDGLCDRALTTNTGEVARASVSMTDSTANISGSPATRCPFGLIDDPYPGQCANYVDTNGNGLCDLSERIEPGNDTTAAGTAQTAAKERDAVATPAVHGQDADQETSCPFGLVDDPYPGQCPRYVDTNGNGICDLSETATVPEDQDSASPTVSPSSPSLPEETKEEQAQVACPFGMVNDPYPGQCRRYVDSNGSGFCDLSEPQDDATTLPAEPLEPDAPQSRRQRRGGGGDRA